WLGRVHMEQGKFDDAATLLMSGSKHAKDGDYFALMALAQQNTDGYKDAVASYRKALNYRPNESKWWLGLGISLEKSENWKDAENAYETALLSENLPFNLHSQTSGRLKFVKDQIALTQKK
ncbi:MAG: tetratricopeptide repeat protein, partial [Gammaproteobacteria bacterium]|nr:tetratricopeptide repeat protein [Gammaproteobacteria bacterium]